MLKLMMIVVIAFAHSKERHNPGIARGTLGRIRLGAEDVAGAVDQECAVLQKNDSSNAGKQEGTERAAPAIPQRACDRRNNEADDDGDDLDIAVLPADEFVFQQIGNVVVG